MKLKSPTPLFIAFLQATGLVLYIVLLAAVEPFIFENSGNLMIFGMLKSLLLFIISALITASVVLGRFAVLFWNKRYKDAFILLGLTISWLIIYYLVIVYLSTQTSRLFVTN